MCCQEELLQLGCGRELGLHLRNSWSHVRMFVVTFSGKQEVTCQTVLGELTQWQFPLNFVSTEPERKQTNQRKDHFPY